MGGILLVDDDRADLTLLTQALSIAAPDVSVTPARTAAEALAALDERPLVVLLDLNMPGTSGFEVLAQIRGHPVHGAVPVVVFTTSAAQRDVDAAYENGANAFITKPADLHDTIEMMRSLVTFWTLQEQP